MMRLAEIQAAFQRHLLDDDASIVAVIDGDERLPAAERVVIYRHAYVARLANALAESHPAVHHALGEPRFAELGWAFVASRPSRFASIRWYGREFADFLAARVPGVPGAGLADLARFEWTLGVAFDAADAAAVEAGDLAGIAPQDWNRLRLRFLPSLQRLRLRSNALEWWRAATERAARPAGWRKAPDSEWVAWRGRLTTSFRSLAAEEAPCLDTALEGRTFGELCEHLVASVGADAAPLRAATLLKRWFAEGWVAGFDLVEAQATGGH